MTAFTEEERVVDDALGYPKAYARLCRAGGVRSAFLPYVLQPHEVPASFSRFRNRYLWIWLPRIFSSSSL